MTKGSLAVISGFSGVGKGTVVAKLLERHEGYALSVSATTRSPRPGETDGVQYHFLSKQAFDELVEKDGLIEHAVYCGNDYGTPRTFVEDSLASGTDVILEIEIQGARHIKEQYPDAALIFLMPPSAEELKKRLVGRGTESIQAVEARLKRAAEESEGIEEYDYIFVNNTPEQCADEIHELISSLRHKTEKNETFINEIRSQVRDFSKGE